MAAWGWGGLRSDLVHRILARLTCFAHRAAFSAVCFNWRSSDGLYFLDDSESFDDVTMALEAGQPFPCTDMGRCARHHQQPQVDLIFPMRPPSEFSPPVWFFHSDPIDV
jgi:hypothetical protein